MNVNYAAISVILKEEYKTPPKSLLVAVPFKKKLAAPKFVPARTVNVVAAVELLVVLYWSDIALG